MNSSLATPPNGRGNRPGLPGALIDLIEGNGLWIGERQVLDGHQVRACLQASFRAAVHLLARSGK